jgi:hypothetical protein
LVRRSKRWEKQSRFLWTGKPSISISKNSCSPPDLEGPGGSEKHLEELRKTGVKLSDEAPFFHMKIAGRVTRAIRWITSRAGKLGEAEFTLLVDENQKNLRRRLQRPHRSGFALYNTNLASSFDTALAPKVWRMRRDRTLGPALKCARGH